MAAALLLLRPELLSGAILLRATMPLEPDSPPKLRGKPVLIAQGESDPYVSPAGGSALEQALRGAGAQVHALRLAQGHPLEQSEIEPIRLWAAAHLR